MKSLVQPQHPTNWPRHVRYIDSTHYHASVLPAIKQQIQELRSTAKSSNSKRPKVVIRPISNQSHPTYGQLGLFAGQRIAAKSQIIDYIGEVHCDDRPNSDYDLSLCRLPGGVNVGVDASNMGNHARFVNDFRGIANKPNALFVDTKTASGEIRISIWSSNREIKKGEEILVSYGKTWWRSRAHLVPKELVATTPATDNPVSLSTERSTNTFTVNVPTVTRNSNMSGGVGRKKPSKMRPGSTSTGPD